MALFDMTNLSKTRQTLLQEGHSAVHCRQQDFSGQDFLVLIREALELADRISNITALGLVHNVPFVKKYLRETTSCLAPKR